MDIMFNYTQTERNDNSRRKEVTEVFVGLLTLPED